MFVVEEVCRVWGGRSMEPPHQTHHSTSWTCRHPFTPCCSHFTSRQDAVCCGPRPSANGCRLAVASCLLPLPVAQPLTCYPGEETRLGNHFIFCTGIEPSINRDLSHATLWEPIVTGGPVPAISQPPSDVTTLELKNVHLRRDCSQRKRALLMSLT